MQYHTPIELLVLAEFEKNNNQLTVFYRRNRTMIHYDKDFAEAFAKLLRKGKIIRVASGDFGWVKYVLNR